MAGPEGTREHAFWRNRYGAERVVRGMECEGLTKAIERWTRAEDAPREEILAYLSHADSCPACRSRYGATLAFIAKDAGLRPSVMSPSWDGNAFRLADTVMAAIGGDTPLAMKRGIIKKHGGRLWYVPVLAAAAIVVFLIMPAIRVPGVMEVRFVMDAPTATSVRLAGDFNEWSGKDMRRDKEGRWEIKVPLKSGRTYTYNFIIDDGQWVADPASEVILDDGFGGRVSSLVL